MALLRQTGDRLAKECTTPSKSKLYELLKTYVAVDREETVPYVKMSAKTSRPIATLRSDSKRLRAL